MGLLDGISFWPDENPDQMDPPPEDLRLFGGIRITWPTEPTELGPLDQDGR